MLVIRELVQLTRMVLGQLLRQVRLVQLVQMEPELELLGQMVLGQLLHLELERLGQMVLGRLLRQVRLVQMVLGRLLRQVRLVQLVQMEPELELLELEQGRLELLELGQLGQRPLQVLLQTLLHNN